MTFKLLALGLVAALSMGQVRVSLARQFIVRPVALQEYYVDPDWTGTKTGAAATPWSTLDASAWTTINAALESADVTVYYSAREAGSDANETTTTPITVSRTAASTRRLVLDGRARYNTSDSAPAWLANPGSRQFQVTATNPMTTGTGERSYVTVRGFRLIANEGQIIFWWGGSHLVIEDNEVSATGAPTYGPGIYYGYTKKEGASNCPTAGPQESCVAFTNITIRRNHVHDTYGEGIYIGGCANWSGCISHDGVLIEANRVGVVATLGGEPDAIDIKDGLRNVVIRANDVRMQTNSRDCVTLESGALVERNYLESCGRIAVAFSEFWNTSNATRANSSARNNVIINAGVETVMGYANRAGIWVDPPNGGGDHFSGVTIYSNTVYRVISPSTTGICIYVGASGTTVRNNIGSECADYALSADASTLTDKSYNLWFESGATPVVVRYGGSSYTTATVTTFDANSSGANPLLVDTAAPYEPSDVKLQASSPAKGTGVALLAIFANDYADAPRGATWDMGAWKY